MSPGPTSILAAFVEHTHRDPARPCLIWQGATISYGDLLTMALAWRDRYVEQEVNRGDRVGLFLGNSPDFIAAYLGAHLAGAAAVLMNTQYRQLELSHIIADSEPKAIVTDAAGLELLAEMGGQRDGGTGGWGVPVMLMVDSPSPAPTSNLQSPISNLPSPSDLAILAYTSGTTGRAKGAMLTHGNLAANSAAVAEAWRWTADDRLLLALPLFHIHGLGVGVHGTLFTGASIELHARFEPAAILNSLTRGTISMFFGVPTMYTRLIQEASQGKQAAGEQAAGEQAAAEQAAAEEETIRSFAPHSLIRLFVSGSAPLSPQTFAEFAELFGQPILERYGMTETVMNLTNPYDGERRPGTVGMPFPGQEARIVDVRSRVPLPDGEIGEIQVRGPHVCAGYWRNPEATAEVFQPDGWFSTGDLGRRSADGYYTITGRARELIIAGGYNIYPREVEEALLQHPEVAECAVFGLPDPDMGEQVAAAVLPRDPTAPPNAEELIAFCRERLAAYKRPRKIYYVNSIPRNAMGKAQKHLLREQLAV